MRGRDIHAIGAAAVGVQQVGADALFIDINGHHLGFGDLEGLAGAVVAGVFHQNRLAGVHQQLRAQIQRLTRTAQDQYLVG